MSAAKYETSLHITPVNLYKLLILNANKQNDYARSKIFKEFGGYKSATRNNYCTAGSFLNALKYGCLVNFRKIIDQTESYMWYTFTYKKICTREVFQKKRGCH